VKRVNEWVEFNAPLDTIYRLFRRRYTSSALVFLMSGKEMRFQIPPETFRLDGWIAQRIGQWVPKPSDRRLRKPKCHKYCGCTDTSDLRHFGPKTFRHHVFGAEVSQIFALVPNQCRNVSDTSALKCMRHFGPRTKKCLEFRHCLKKGRPTLCSLL